MALLDTLHFPIPNTLRKSRLYFMEMVFSIKYFEKRKTAVIALVRTVSNGISKMTREKRIIDYSLELLLDREAEAKA